MNKATSRETFIPVTTMEFSNDGGCYIKKVRCMFLITLFLGILIGVIILAVLYTRKEQCDTLQQTTMSINPTITSAELSGTTVKPTIKNEDFRLPKNLIPLTYNLFIQPYINGTPSYFEGNVSITILVLNRTNNIILHSRYLNVSNIKFCKVSNDCLSDAMNVHESINEITDMLIINLDEELNVNDTYQLSISFTGSMDKKMYKGFYVGSYKDEKNEIKYYASTQFQTTSAREAFPCFDEPGFKARFTINIKRQAPYKSLSNMELESSTPQEDGWILDTFKESVPMSTYLVAFIVSQFNGSSDSSNFNVWSNPALFNQTAWSLEIGKKIQDHLGKLLNSPYPLNKTDMVAIPHFAAGAMENWGLIFYREIAMLYSQAYANIIYKQYVISVVAHEINHMWFGNLVSPKWWSDSWLNEAFASYFVYPVLAEVHTDWKNYNDFITTDDCAIAYEVDAKNNSSPMKYDIFTSSEVANIFDNIIYSKGACFLHMTLNVLGEDRFMNGIKNFIKENEYGVVEQDDLFSYWTKDPEKNASDSQISNYLNKWTLEAGYPVVLFSSFSLKNVTLNESFIYVNVSQQRFLSNPSQSSKEVIWNIPLTFFTKNTGIDKNIYWLNDKEKEMKLKVDLEPNSWIIANVKRAGFYRVNYEKENWDLLIAALKNNYDDIHELNRAQLISDSFSLSRAGMLNYSIPLSLLSYLKNETKYAPWKMAADELYNLFNLLLESPNVYKFMNHVRDIVDAVYRAVSRWRRWPDDSNLNQQLLDEVIVDLACSYGSDKCINKAREVFDNWKQEIDTGVSALLLETALCTSIRHGTSDDWTFVYNKFTTTLVIGEKMDLLYSLSCTRNPVQLKKLMLNAMDPNEVNPLNAYRVFRGIAINEDSRFMYLDFLQEHWEKFETGFSGLFSRAVVNSITYIVSGFSSLYEKERISNFKDMVDKKYQRIFDSALEIIDENIQWRKKYEQQIIDFIVET